MNGYCLIVLSELANRSLWFFVLLFKNISPKTYGPHYVFKNLGYPRHLARIESKTMNTERTQESS
jgi:hypothetical protein